MAGHSTNATLMMTPVCDPQVSVAAMTVPTVAAAMAGIRTDHCGRYLVRAYAAIGSAAETSDCRTTSATARISIDSGQRRRNAMTAMMTGIRTASRVGGHGMLASCSSRMTSRMAAPPSRAASRSIGRSVVHRVHRCCRVRRLDGHRLTVARNG